MSEDQDIEMSTDEALLSALTPKQVGEIELQPFSLMRQIISVDLCRTSTSNFFNAVMTVWVCTLQPMEALKAHADISQAQLQAFEWAQGQGYSIVHYRPLLDAYARLNRELEASTRVQVLEASENGAKNAGGRPLA